MNTLPEYQFRGARAMVLLHETYMREFLQTWKEAKLISLHLPETDDPDYQSLESLLRHALRAARGYMTWMCEKLELPDPQIESTPEIDEIEERCDSYLEHLLERWQIPLAQVPTEKFFEELYMSRWGKEYCIEAMLEHAVVHPMRHTFQLQEIMSDS